MKVFYGIDRLPSFEKPVLTIGTFDGVHQGHQSILQSVVNEAKAIKGTSVLITFEPHPRKLIFPNEPLKLLCTLEERLALVAHAQIDVVVVVPFTKAFAALSAEKYISNFLVAQFRPFLIIIGYDHRFGHDRTGDITMLRSYVHQFQYEVKEISAQLISAAAVSSTKVRNLLAEGNVASAYQMLGSAYSISGKVIRGAQRGRSIGFPTANIALLDTDKLVPKIGVYAVRVFVKDHWYKGMLNLGYNPTVVTDNEVKIEVHLFAFDQDIYDHEIRVCFISRLRNEQKFDSLEALKGQLQQDKVAAMAALSNL
jgi:riboflavin kinase/FMN adenylyltransferase